jgi:hypothetical protein
MGQGKRPQDGDASELVAALGLFGWQRVRQVSESMVNVTVVVNILGREVPIMITKIGDEFKVMASAYSCLNLHSKNTGWRTVLDNINSVTTLSLI